MKKRFYIDTCIWRDYFEDRKDNIKPLGEFAFQFLKKCREENAVVIFSDILMRELEIDFSREYIKSMLSDFKELVIHVKHTQKQFEEALCLKKLRKFPLADILHSIIARDNNAVLVSRDFHFKEIAIAETNSPEYLI